MSSIKFFSELNGNKEYRCIRKGISTFKNLKALDELNSKLENTSSYKIDVRQEKITSTPQKIHFKIFLIEKKMINEDIPFLPLLRLFIPKNNFSSIS